MPDNECDEQFSQKLDISTRPLHVITQYPNAESESMQSPGRPTTLGICSSNTQNFLSFKNGSITFRNAFSQDGSNQSWKLRAVDAVEFEKLVGQLGNNGSTPVTPTTFLNPSHLTEDQERFADNFSRTLDKVKAEQEGWAAAVISNENSLDNAVTNSSFDKQLHSERADQVNFVGSFLNDENNLDSTTNDSTQPCIQLSGANSSRTGSPSLADPSIVLLSSSNGSQIQSQSRLTPTRRESCASVKSKSPTPSPFSQTYFVESLTTDETHTSNGTVWTTGLPTILSIASGLKQTASLRSSINQDSSRSPGQNEAISHSLTMNPVIPNGDSSLCGAGDGPSLKQQQQQHEEAQSQEEQTIHSKIGTKLPFTLSSLNEAERSHILLRCAVRNNTPPVHLLESTDESLLDSLIPVTTDSRLPLRTDGGHYDIRDNMTGLYATTNTNLSSESEILQPILATTLSPSISSSSVPLGVMGSSPSSYGTENVGTMSGLIGGSQSRSLDICLNTTDASHHVDVSAPGSQITVDTLLHANHSNLDRVHSMPLSPNARLFNGSMYANPPNSFGISSDGSRDDLVASASSIILSRGQHFSGSMLSTLPPLVGPHADSHPFHPRSVKSVPNDSHLMSNFGCPNNTTLDLQHSSSDPKSLFVGAPPMSSDVGSSCTTELTGFPLTSMASAGPPKKTKVTGAATKRSRMLSMPRASVPGPANPIQAGSDQMGTQVSGLSSDSKKGQMKRSRINYARLQSFANGADFGSGISESNGLVMSHQLFPSDQTQCYNLKQEPIDPDELDDLSTPSESLSAGTGHTTCDNTQVSSLDETEQLNRKLERKRARNRVAARRCRERKLSLIQTLQHEVALKDAHVRSLEDALERYRTEGELLKQHVESLASSYPDLKAEFYKFPFLFQRPPSSSTDLNPSGMSKQTTPVKTEAPDNLNSEHFI